MIAYSVLKNGVVIRTGSCAVDDLVHQANDGEEVVEGLQPFPVFETHHHWSHKRKLAYPPLEDFADAFLWKQKGDDSKMQAYIAACDAVKLAIPKKIKEDNGND